MRSGYALSPHPFNTILVILTRTIRQEKEMKGTRMGKEKDTALFTHRKRKTIYQQPSKLLNELNKTTGYNVDIQKSAVFLHTGNKQIKNKL